MSESNTDLAKAVEHDDLLKIWDKEQWSNLRAMFAPNATDAEFKILVGLGKSLGANPFVREIWFVKYGSGQAQIFTGRDFNRRKAQEQPDYLVHKVDVIYTGDVAEFENGILVNHKYTIESRMSKDSKIYGAYCILQRKGKPPFTHFVRFAEYYQGRVKPDGKIKQVNKNGEWKDMKPTLWDEKPETMIKKVAEDQCTRMAYQGIFKGTYGEAEQWIDRDEVKSETNQAPGRLSMEEVISNAEEDQDSGATDVEVIEEMESIKETESSPENEDLEDSEQKTASSEWNSFVDASLVGKSGVMDNVPSFLQEVPAAGEKTSKDDTAPVSAESKKDLNQQIKEEGLPFG